jgi:hypothetical protein
MRLLKLNDDGSFSLEWFSEDKAPPYAILSHTWGTGKDDEVTFKDLKDGTGNNKPGFQKLQFCGNQAKHDDLHYFWVDTCCIDKTNHVELSEAINSMFQWYQKAAKCYVYLSDVSVSKHVEWESAFRNSRWFRRGWTLQELLAPKIVDFYSRDGVRLGDKSSQKQQIAEVTKIAVEALQGQPLSTFSVEERFSWVEKPQTTKKEDMAYCLLGIFKKENTKFDMNLVERSQKWADNKKGQLCCNVFGGFGMERTKELYKAGIACKGEHQRDFF